MPINLSIGDPSAATCPRFVTEALAQAARSFGNYPAIIGTEDWRQAAADWLNRRFGLNGAIDPEKNLLPLNGTREGLFLVLFPADAADQRWRQADRGDAQSFLSMLCRGGVAAGAEPLYVAATERGFPARLCRLAGSNPGAVGGGLYLLAVQSRRRGGETRSYWRNCSRWRTRHDFIVLADECYADIYFGQPPVCALPARLTQAGGFAPASHLSFPVQALRPAGPALRMVAGDAELIAKFRAFRNVAGPQMPGPILAASAAAWRDEAHVAANRAPPMRKKWRRPNHPGQPHVPQPAGRLFPLAEDRQWRGNGAASVARTGGQGPARRLYGARN